MLADSNCGTTRDGVVFLRHRLMHQPQPRQLLQCAQQCSQGRGGGAGWRMAGGCQTEGLASSRASAQCVRRGGSLMMMKARAMGMGRLAQQLR
eukprot:3216353-Pleurochrysis_carterae.AAC.1